RNRQRVFAAKGSGQPQPAGYRQHRIAEFFDRIKAIVLDEELDELLVATKRGRRDEETAQRLISRSWIEFVVALVSYEAWTDSAQPDRLRIALNLFDCKVFGQIENAYALKVVAEVYDEIERVPFLNLKVGRVSVGAEVFFTESSGEERDQSW